MQGTRKPRVRFDAAKVVSDMGDRGWSESELARQAGLSAQAINLFVRGIRQTPFIATKIAKAFGRKTSRRYRSHIDGEAA